MSEYQSQFVSNICCCTLEIEKYVSDMMMEMKKAIRKMTKEDFSIWMKVRDGEGKEYEFEMDGMSAFSEPHELCGQRCSELPVEIYCKAACDPDRLKEQLHRAIAGASAINNMTPFYFREDVNA